MHSFWDSVKEGFALVNRNWQLVPIKVAASIINCILFFIIVGIPLVVTIIVAGLKFTYDSPELFFSELKDMLAGGYLGLVLLVISGIIIYLLLALSVWVYAFAGSYGVLGKKLEEPGPFRMREFFFGAREFFWSFMGFYTLVGIGLMLASILIGLAMGGAFFIVTLLRESTLAFSVIAGVVLVIVILSFGVAFLFASLTIGTFGSAVIVLERERPWPALKKAITFIKENPAGLWGFSLLLLFYLLISFVMMVLGYPFQLIPFIGVLMMLAIYALGRYMGLVLAGTAFTYYFRVKGYGSSAEFPPPDESLHRSAPPE